jgi:general stress protein YciG
MTNPPQKTSGRSKAGQKGGKTTSSLYGPDFYAQIGRKGGKARRRARPQADTA